jgi:hypothetical protein
MARGQEFKGAAQLFDPVQQGLRVLWQEGVV